MSKWMRAIWAVLVTTPLLGALIMYRRVLLSGVGILPVHWDFFLRPDSWGAVENGVLAFGVVAVVAALTSLMFAVLYRFNDALCELGEKPASDRARRRLRAIYVGFALLVDLTAVAILLRLSTGL